MKNLVIGNTSQLSQYFPDNYEKISSRNINFDEYKDKFYDRIYVCFSEQRTFLSNEYYLLFYDVNVKLTTEIIEFFYKICNKLIYYSTAELWNDCIGEIDLKTTPKYKHHPYTITKDKMTLDIRLNKNHRLRSENDKWENVIIIYPFNFNSPYRKGDFLFAKIFNSIINEQPIEIGDTFFYRDIVHPKYIVEQSIISEEDKILGSGRLIFVNDFIKDLYSHYNLNYFKLVKQNDIYSNKNIFYLKSKDCLYPYKQLLTDTILDINTFKNIKN